MSPKSPRLKVANRLRVLRAEADITQETLANDVGVTRVTMKAKLVQFGLFAGNDSEAG